MSLITIVWSMTASACLTLALIHAFVWWRQRHVWANLLFTLATAGTAAFAACELAVMRAPTLAAYGSAVRWAHVPVWIMVLSLAGFVKLYFRAGRAWLVWAVCGLRTVSLLLNFITGQNLNYRHISKLMPLSFLGESVSVADGVPNPWMLVSQLSLVLLIVLVADATITVWRRGERRLAVMVGGSILFCLLAATAQAVVVYWGIVHWPSTAALFYLGIVVAMGYELSREAATAAWLGRKLRESEQRMTRAAEAANLGELTSALAHELNQPLAAILSNAQAAQRFLRRDQCDLNEIREILGEIIADDERASEIIRRLRALFKRNEFQPQALHVNDLVHGVITLMNGELTARAVSVVADLSADLPCIDGDPVQLQQVLINLLLNAADAMAPAATNARTLTLRSCRTQERAIEISVTDTGAGISRAAEEKLFEPYYTTKAHGLGLGLSLSRSIILAHGGRIWAENRPGGGGAVVRFTLPELATQTRQVAR